MYITATVMAHPRRKVAAESLALQLKKYPFMDVSITYDEIGNEWHTGERSLRKGVNRGDYHLVIQDDAILTPNFYENIEKAINAAPLKTLISLYTGTVKPFPTRVTEAVKKAYHATWLSHHMLLWGVAIVIPSDHIEPMLEFIEDRTEQYDTRIGIFYQANMIPIYYTMPCLVDHDDDLGSLIANHQTIEPRKAHRLASGLVEWNKHVIQI